MNWISRAPAAALILWIASSNPAFSQPERGDCAQDRAGVNCGSNTRGSGGSGSSSSGSDYNAARERQRALDELTSSLGRSMEESRQQRNRNREDREYERLRREQAEYEDQQRRWAEEERERERAKASNLFWSYRADKLVASQKEIWERKQSAYPWKRVNVDGSTAILRGSDPQAAKSCSKIENGVVTNNCTDPLNVGWWWVDGSGACRLRTDTLTGCGATVAPGDSISVANVDGGTANTLRCLAPSIPVLSENQKNYDCYTWIELPPEPPKDSGGAPAVTQEYASDDPSQFRSQIGNKALLASEASLAALQKRGAISGYGFDKSLLASHCIRSFYETFPTGGKSSRLENTCDRKVHVSWFDSEGPCKERSAADWTCSTAIGPRKTIGTTRQPDGARREFGACFDPGLPVRQGGRHSCAAWLNMGGSSYQPGTSFEPAVPR